MDAFELINQKYSKKCEVYFIMGSDNFKKMSKWKDYNKIKDQKYIVIKRVYLNFGNIATKMKWQFYLKESKKKSM